MNNEFKKMVDNDIEEIDIVINEEKYTNEFYKGIIAKYHNYIRNLGDGLYGYSQTAKFYCDEEGESLKHNLIILKGKLSAFKAHGYSNNEKETGTNITFSNSNVNQISISATFNNVREKIEEMTSLREQEIQEILEKVNELENIINSKERKSKKWESCNSIIKWIADKGVDVGISLLPLLLQGFQ